MAKHRRKMTGERMCEKKGTVKVLEIDKETQLEG